MDFTYKMLIDGQWVEARNGKTWEVVNPATEERLATALTNVTNMMRVSCEEVFGPVMPISSFATLEEGLALANGTPYGLAGYVMTTNLETATRAYEGLKFGIVGVNDLTPATAEGPFGGVKESGFGREAGQEGLHEYLDTKFVSMAFPT
jgi:succinate-semialdehyde dehydrogenase/glutarate-semialdehyde dehydrogenase